MSSRRQQGAAGAERHAQGVVGQGTVHWVGGDEVSRRRTGGSKAPRRDPAGARALRRRRQDGARVWNERNKVLESGMSARRTLVNGMSARRALVEWNGVSLVPTQARRLVGADSSLVSGISSRDRPRRQSVYASESKTCASEDACASEREGPETRRERRRATRRSEREGPRNPSERDGLQSIEREGLSPGEREGPRNLAEI